MGLDSSFEVDRERLERLFPPRTADPGVRAAVILQVPDREVEDFERGLLGGEVAAVADHLPQPGVHRLDQVRRIDHPADLGREGQERSELLPVRPPQPDDRRIALLPLLRRRPPAPRPRRFRSLRCRRRADRLDSGAQYLRRHTARRRGSGGRRRSGRSPAARRCPPPRAGPFSPSQTTKNTSDAAVAQVGQHAHPELRALAAGAGPQAQDVFLTLEADADRQRRWAGWRPGRLLSWFCR